MYLAHTVIQDLCLTPASSVLTVRLPSPAVRGERSVIVRLCCRACVWAGGTLLSLGQC